MKRAFAIYECDEGWCIEPLHMSMGSYRTGRERKSVAAFSRLHQALWWLPRNLERWNGEQAANSENAAETGLSRQS